LHLWRDYRAFVLFATIQNRVEAGDLIGVVSARKRCACADAHSTGRLSVEF
jgi:hypothetical protein